MKSPVRQGLREVLDHAATAWVAGVALPLAMVALDPAVFRSTTFGVGTPILGAWKPLGYVGIFLGMAAVACHLVAQRASAVLAGALAGAALFAVALGLCLLPFSLLGLLFFGLGLLGLTPFVSAVVVAWRARLAFRRAQGRGRLRHAFLGLLLFLGTGVAAQWRATRAFDHAVSDLRSGRPERVEAAVQDLARWRILLDLDRLVPIWDREQAPATKQSFAQAYERVTGEKIEGRADVLVD